MSAFRLVLGTVQWGQLYGIAGRGVPEDAELARILARARRAGVAALDTARAYGAAEARLGAHGAATAFAIQTKLASDLCDDGDDPERLRARAAASLDESFAALGTDRVDAVLLHRVRHRNVAGGVAWDVLRRARRRGAVRAIGVSATTPEEAWAALSDPEIERVQVATSLLDQRLWRAGYFDAARRAGKEVQVRSVYLQGVAFLAPDALPEALAPLRDPLLAIERWANAHGLSVPEAFLLFALGLPRVSLVVGFEREAQLAAALAAVRRRALGPGERAELASLVPPLDADLLEPSRWPSR